MDVRAGYKQTELGEIPEEWDLLLLSQVFKLTSGKSRPQMLADSQTLELAYPVYGGNGVIGFSDTFLVDHETLVVGRVGAYCGSVHKAPKHSWITDNALYVAEMVTGEVSLSFLSYLLSFLNLNNYQARSGQPLITQTQLGKIRVAFPALSEQFKITSILSIVDDSIHKSEQIITKTHQLKKGLMQQLFTRGIGHTRFTDTKIGKLPDGWGVTELGNIAEITMGQSPAGDTYNGAGVGKPLINGPAEFGDLYPTPVQWTTKPTKMCKVSDVLFCVRGNTAGRLNRADQEYCIGRGISAIRGCPYRANTDFVYYLLEHQRPIIYRIGAGAGSTFPNIGFHDLSTYNVALPPLSEQQVIASIFSTLDKKIEKDAQKRELLERFKKGLMNDLLTGKVRVQVT